MDIDQDDLPVGRVLTRREMLILLGAGGSAAILAACAPGAAATAIPSAAATSGATERPRHGDRHRDRRRIRPARLRRPSRGDRGALLRRREARALGHPPGPVGRLGP